MLDAITEAVRLARVLGVAGATHGLERGVSRAVVAGVEELLRFEPETDRGRYAITEVIPAGIPFQLRASLWRGAERDLHVHHLIAPVDLTAEAFSRLTPLWFCPSLPRRVLFEQEGRPYYLRTLTPRDFASLFVTSCQDEDSPHVYHRHQAFITKGGISDAVIFGVNEVIDLEGRHRNLPLLTRLSWLLPWYFGPFGGMLLAGTEALVRGVEGSPLAAASLGGMISGLLVTTTHLPHMTRTQKAVSLALAYFLDLLASSF